MHKWRRFIRHSCGVVFALTVLLLASEGIAGPSTNNSPEKFFQNPPHDAKPLTWWHWIDGNITREGITSDMEAMREAGIAGAYMFNVGLGLPEGPARFMSPQWLDLVGHAIREADRLIGDERYPELTEKDARRIPKEWPDWLWKGEQPPGPRRTFSTRRMYRADDPLLPSGLLGPVKLRPVAIREIKRDAQSRSQR